ncbi:IclR family transcriptional regulator C-terminal domain-containing protein [Undibacterium arcticum]
MDEIGETCNVSMLDGNAMVYLDRVETPSPLRLNLQPGSHVPLHCTSSGKLLLSQLSRSQRQKNCSAMGRCSVAPSTRSRMCLSWS